MTEPKTEPAAKEEEPKSRIPTISYREFLETSPALHPVKATDLFRMSGQNCYLNEPILTLHCEHEMCQGPRFFAHRSMTGGLHTTDRGERNEVFVRVAAYFWTMAEH